MVQLAVIMFRGGMNVFVGLKKKRGANIIALESESGLCSTTDYVKAMRSFLIEILSNLGFSLKFN